MCVRVHVRVLLFYNLYFAGETVWNTLCPYGHYISL
jgi:hypothetical protein